MLESEIKRKSKEKLESWGWLVIHLIQTNWNGIPDTLLIHPEKGIAFIEFKRPGENPDKLQEYRIDKLRKMGVRVFVIRSLNDLTILK